MTVYKVCGSFQPSRSVIIVIFSVIVTFCVAIAWIQPGLPQRISFAEVAEKEPEFDNKKVTSVVSTSQTWDVIKVNSKSSVKKADRPGSRSTKRSVNCPNSSGHVTTIDYASTARSNRLCKDQGKLIVYSKPRGGFPVDNFRDHNNSVADCKLPDGVTCSYTEDDNLYSTADVLYIHECFSLCETPAYPEQIVVRYNMGPEIERRPCNNATIQVADIKTNYHVSSTIPWLYLCAPDIKQPLMDALRLDVPSNRHGIAMFVSDCKANFSQWRYKYLKELMKYIKIDSYGKCLHNTKMKSTRKNIKRDDIKLGILKRYKFLIAFENTHVSEYISEKIWHAYMSQTIPIYYGAPEIYEQVPGRNTFIDAAKFSKPKQLAEYIKKVDRNMKLYRSFFDFDLSHLEEFEKAWCSEIPLSCHICNKAYQIKQSRCKI